MNSNNPFAPVQIDFSQLANLPDAYRQGQKWRQEQDLRKAFAKGLQRIATDKARKRRPTSLMAAKPARGVQ